MKSYIIRLINGQTYSFIGEQLPVVDFVRDTMVGFKLKDGSGMFFTLQHVTLVEEREVL